MGIIESSLMHSCCTHSPPKIERDIKNEEAIVSVRPIRAAGLPRVNSEEEFRRGLPRINSGEELLKLAEELRQGLPRIKSGEDLFARARSTPSANDIAQAIERQVWRQECDSKQDADDMRLRQDARARERERETYPSSQKMQVIARANFDKWNAALQTKDQRTVAGMYSATKLSFLPTVSPKHVTSLTSTQDYFEAFVQKSPFGTITDDQVQVYNDGNTYLHSGMYTFELGQDDKRTSVSARFSFVWVKEGDDWKITHHHSSVCPAENAKQPSSSQSSSRVDSGRNVPAHN